MCNVTMSNKDLAYGALMIYFVVKSTFGEISSEALV